MTAAQRIKRIAHLLGVLNVEMITGDNISSSSVNVSVKTSQMASWLEESDWICCIRCCSRPCEGRNSLFVSDCGHIYCSICKETGRLYLRFFPRRYTCRHSLLSRLYMVRYWSSTAKASNLLYLVYVYYLNPVNQCIKCQRTGIKFLLITENVKVLCRFISMPSKLS